MLEASILLEDATDSTKHPSGEIVNRFAHKLLDKEGELCYYFTQPLTSATPKKQGGLAVFGKTLTITGFRGLRLPPFHRDGADNSPKKNEVSGLGGWNSYHNWAEKVGGLRLLEFLPQLG